MPNPGEVLNPPFFRFIHKERTMGDDASEKLVRQFRQIVLWPLQLMPLHEGTQIQKHWELLTHRVNLPAFMTATISSG